MDNITLYFGVLAEIFPNSKSENMIRNLNHTPYTFGGQLLTTHIGNEVGRRAILALKAVPERVCGLRCLYVVYEHKGELPLQLYTVRRCLNKYSILQLTIFTRACGWCHGSFLLETNTNLRRKLFRVWKSAFQT